MESILKSGMPNILDPGSRFGSLVIVDRAKHATSRGVHYQCKCDCGEMRMYRVRDLKAGEIISCGCSKRNRPKGRRKTSLYRTWINMVRRCKPEHADQYPTYAGRGITVCDHWLKFDNFARDVGERPSPKHSIGRIDNDKGYEPGNVRWETKEQQVNNRIANRVIEFGGKTLNVTQWAAETGLDPRTLTFRLNNWGDVGRALTAPHNAAYSRKK